MQTSFAFKPLPKEFPGETDQADHFTVHQSLPTGVDGDSHMLPLQVEMHFKICRPQQKQEATVASVFSVGYSN